MGTVVITYQFGADFKTDSLLQPASLVGHVYNYSVCLRLYDHMPVLILPLKQVGIFIR